MNLSISDAIQLFSICVAIILGLISIGISIFTLRQNSKMIEESTRPIIIIYSELNKEDKDLINLVVKNIGKSCATIEDFKPSFDFSSAKSYISPANDLISSLITLSMPPESEYTIKLKYNTINQPVTFDIKYRSSAKTYCDKIPINLKAGLSLDLFQ